MLSRISQLANERGTNIYQLQKDLKLSNNTIYSWKDSTPQIESLLLVADYFKVSLDYLLGRSDNRFVLNEKISSGLFQSDLYKIIVSKKFTDQQIEIIVDYIKAAIIFAEEENNGTK